jgi:hypothetical protein
MRRNRYLRETNKQQGVWFSLAVVAAVVMALGLSVFLAPADTILAHTASAATKTAAAAGNAPSGNLDTFGLIFTIAGLTLLTLAGAMSLIAKKSKI